MAYVTFTGDQDGANGTSLDFLQGLDQYLTSNFFGERPTEIVIYNGGDDAGRRAIHFQIDAMTPATGFVPSFHGSGWAGAGLFDLLQVHGLTEAVELDPTLDPTSQYAILAPQLQKIIAGFLRGSDTILLSGQVSNFWGDYRNVAAADPDIMGDDYFRASNISLPTASTSLIVYGDAQIVLDGATAHGGDDVINATSNSTPLTAFGDFQFVNGTATFGSDTIYGGSSTDILYGDNQAFGAAGGNDLLAGGGGTDQLYGGGGNDVLTGQAGADILDGGAGTDAASYQWSTAGVTADLLTPANNTSEAAGDAYIGIEGLVGGRYEDTLRGNDLPNSLSGGVDDDNLAGRGGNDTLNGDAGADTMDGGLGNDIFHVDNAADITIEAAGQGSDTVVTTVSYALGAGQEIETLSTANQAATAAISLTGNNLAQRINGNNGSNVLYGGGGNDLLVGYGGNDNIEGQAGSDTLKGVTGIDKFVFRQSTVATSGADHIADFGADDFIFFDHPSVTGALSPLAFVNGPNALDANDRFIYYAPYKSLYFDPDGSGATAKVLMAVFDNGYTPTAADIMLF